MIPGLPIEPGEKVRIDGIPLEALSEEMQREFLKEAKACGWPSGDAVMVGYRGRDSDGTHLVWAVTAP